MKEGEVVNDEFSPCGEMTSAGTIAAESGEQGFTRKTAFVHSADVAQPAEAIDAKLVSDGTDVASASD